MSLHETDHWIVTYDIREPRRGVRVHRHLKARGIPVQYSVFSLRLTMVQAQQLMRELEQLIDPRVDDVRAYRLPVRTQVEHMGREMLPEGVWLDVDSPDAQAIAESSESERP
jgi:CRISPR-associated protein Cas2